MIKDCKENKFKSPVWIETETTTTVTFPGITHHRKGEGIAKGINEGINEDVKEKINKILLVLYKEGGIRTVDIKARIDVPVKSVERYIKLLRESGIIEFKGANRTGGYYLTEEIENLLK